MVKPQLYKQGNIEAIISEIEKEGFTILGKKKMKLSLELAEDFYMEHKDRKFYTELITMMTRYH